MKVVRFFISVELGLPQNGVFIKIDYHFRLDSIIENYASPALVNTSCWILLPYT